MKEQKYGKFIVLLVPVALFLALAIITGISVFGYRPVRSADLQVQTREEGGVIYTDYVDQDGRITFASDKGYATLCEKRVNGDLTVFTALDENGQPVALSAGYDELRRTLTSDGKADTDTYYLRGEQVARKRGYYQYARRYNEKGKLCEIRYLDQSGQLVMTSMGYAAILRTYRGNAQKDMYYDTEGKPAKASLGQFGKIVEKKDEATTVTYVDADGTPSNTEKGYAVVKREGSKTLYFDKDGAPVTVGRGQYGVEKDEDGQNVYLDEEGEPMFRLDNFLNTHPVLVLLLGILVTAIAFLLKGKWRIAFLILYICFIGIMTIAYRETGDPRGEFELFASFRCFFTSAATRQNILNNIWLFVPLGAAVYSEKRRWLWLVPIGLSILIETIQYFAGIGVASIDDVVTNGLGGVIGYGLHHVLVLMKSGLFSANSEMKS